MLYKENVLSYRYIINENIQKYDKLNSINVCRVIFLDLKCQSNWYCSIMLDIMNKKHCVVYFKGRSLDPFNIYINNMHDSDKLKLVMFADCTNMLYSNRNYECVYNTVNNELDGYVIINYLLILVYY